MFVFLFWLTSLCIIGSRFIHLIRSDSQYVFWLSRNLVLTVGWGVGCYWHLAGRGLGCCRASYSVRNSPLHQGIMWPNKSVVLRWSVLDGLLRNERFQERMTVRELESRYGKWEKCVYMMGKKLSRNYSTDVFTWTHQFEFYRYFWKKIKWVVNHVR